MPFILTKISLQESTSTYKQMGYILKLTNFIKALFAEV